LYNIYIPRIDMTRGTVIKLGKDSLEDDLEEK
jgi:hypothetical protein